MNSNGKCHNREVLSGMISIGLQAILMRAVLLSEVDNIEGKTTLVIGVYTIIDGLLIRKLRCIMMAIVISGIRDTAPMLSAH